MAELRIDRKLGHEVWPKLQKIDHVQFEDNDLLLACGGFEDRAMKIFENIKSQKIRNLTVFDFVYLPMVEDNQDLLIGNICEAVHCRHIRVEYDRCNPSGIYEKVTELFPKKINNIYLDTSGMSRLLIIQLLVGLITRDVKCKRIYTLYTEAESYPPTKQEASLILSKYLNDFSEITSFISNGIHDLAIVPELSSFNVSQPPLQLIAFPSFNTAQLFSAKSILQPAKISLIHGIPPSDDMSWRPEAIAKLNAIDESELSMNASTLHYEETLRLLLNIYGEYSEFYNFVISPTGSKMQAVATGIFRTFVEDIQIVYPTPLEFINPKNHTIGAKQQYLLDIEPFRLFRSQYGLSYR